MRYWQHWDNLENSKIIDKYWTARESGFRKRVAADIIEKLGAGISILEVGCGSGLIYEEMNKSRIVNEDTYVGGDVSKEMLSIARVRFPKVSFVDLDIFNLPYPDSSQENVICIQVLQHLPEYVTPMEELLRITKNHLYVVTWFVKEEEDNIRFIDVPLEGCEGKGYNNRYSMKKFKRFLSEKGVQNVEISGLGNPCSVTIRK